MACQQVHVGVEECNGQLSIFDLSSGECLAMHALRQEKGKILKNYRHYWGQSQRTADLKAYIVALLPDDGPVLCQLLGAQQILSEHTPIDHRPINLVT